MSLETIVAVMADDPDQLNSGAEWVFANVFGYGRGLGDSYLSVDWQNGLASNRLTFLAEMLFHFQHIEGIERLIACMKSDTIESTFAELEALRILFQSRILFRLVAPRGEKGSDFDVELMLPNGLQVSCELKCKLEVTELTTRTILDTLKRAVTQLPADGANVIFVKLPTSWVSKAGANETIEEAIRRLFGQSGRLAAVVFHWQESVQMPTDLRVQMLRRRLVVNSSSPFAQVITTDLIGNLYTRADDVPWRHFADLAAEVAVESHLIAGLVSG